MHFNLKRPRCSTKTFSIERSRRVRNARGLRSRVTDTEAHILQNSFGNGFLNFFLSCRPSYVEIDIFLRMRLICLRKAAFRSMYSYITSEIFETRCRGKICCRVRASVGGGGGRRVRGRLLSEKRPPADLSPSIFFLLECPRPRINAGVPRRPQSKCFPLLPSK